MCISRTCNIVTRWVAANSKLKDNTVKVMAPSAKLSWRHDLPECACFIPVNSLLNERGVGNIKIQSTARVDKAVNELIRLRGGVEKWSGCFAEHMCFFPESITWSNGGFGGRKRFYHPRMWPLRTDACIITVTYQRADMKRRMLLGAYINNSCKDHIRPLNPRIQSRRTLMT